MEIYAAMLESVRLCEIIIDFLLAQLMLQTIAEIFSVKTESLSNTSIHNQKFRDSFIKDDIEISESYTNFEL